MKGKNLSLAGSIVSIVFSLFGLMVFSIYKNISNQKEIIDPLKESYMENGMTAEDVDQIIKGIESFARFAFNATIVFIILGVLALIFVIRVNKDNKKAIGLSLIGFSILHLFALRLLAFFLLLVGGIQLTKVDDVEQIGKDEEFFNELKNE